MTEYHPLTEKILSAWSDIESPDALDQIIREHTAPKQMVVESGVAFPQHVARGAEVDVSATFIESGNQMQMTLIGTEPVLLLQPEYDIDRHRVTLVLTAVDLDPAGLEQIIDVVDDAVKEMARQQSVQQAQSALERSAQEREATEGPAPVAPTLASVEDLPDVD